MWVFHQIIVLCSLVSFLEAQKPSLPANPECNGMNAAAKHLSNGIRVALQKNAQCKSNKHCSGVICSWSGGGSLEVDLHHCQEPVNYHLFFKQSGSSSYENFTLKKGDEQKLYDSNAGSIKIKVTKLERTENIVTTSVILELCSLGRCLPSKVMENQKFCVRMENCPNYNRTIHQYKPCGYKPTSLPKQPTSGHRGGSSDYPSDGSFKHHKGDPKDDHSGVHLSTGAIIGICAAGLVAILVVVGVVVYWKKYHHRSRLRAAYYNDISMHDPLYEDFGPEVA